MPQAAASRKNEHAIVAETQERLVARWSAAGVEPDTVRGAVAEAFDRLSDARIRSFLPILVERSVRMRLTGAA